MVLAQLVDACEPAAGAGMADETTGETKPVPKQEGSVINLIVKDQSGAEVHFKVKTHTKLEKVRPMHLVVPAAVACYTSYRVTTCTAGYQGILRQEVN